VNRFNLTFRGEIVEGHDPEQVRARLAELLDIEDPGLLQRCFSGDPVVLRRNLERKEAAELYARLRRMGIHVDLVKIGERGDLHAGETGTSPGLPREEQEQEPQPAPAPEKPQPKQAKEDTERESPIEAVAAKDSPPTANDIQDTGRNWPTAPATAVVGSPGTTAKLENSKADEAIRRADLAASKQLQSEQDAELKAREKALKKALLSKEKEEARRARASEKAQKAKQAREVKHKNALAAAKRRAELAEKKRSAEARVAELKAKLEREQEAAAARRREELESEQAEAARRDAVARAERERREAQERERVAAERAEQARLEQARQEEKRRQAAEKAAQKEQEKRKAEEMAAKLQVENARRKREQAEAAARRRAEEVLRKAREEEQRRAQEEDQKAQRRAMEEQPIQRAATELAHKPGLKPVDGRVKTRLETPSIQRRSSGNKVDGKRKKQSGAPNLFSLRPFRNTPGIRDRAVVSNRAMRIAYTVAVISLVVAAALAARLATLPAATQLAGPNGMITAPQDRLLLQAGPHLLMHDRSGVSISQLSFDSLGVAGLFQPMAFDRAGNLLATGEITTASTPKTGPLLRCDLTARACEAFAAELAGTVISALTVHPIDGSLFIADNSAGELIRLDSEGFVLGRTSIELPPHPILQLDSGLLLINSALGPGISVYRYEENAFGEQLDEVLLLPGAGNAKEINRVTDFVRNGEYWWAILEKAQGTTTGLYRFDSQWQFVDRPTLAMGTRPVQLANWGGRTLVRDPTRVEIQRFNRLGAVEAPLSSRGLIQLLEEQGHKSSLIQLGWRIALAVSLLVAMAGLCLGGLHRLRSLVYTSCKERGAAPVDKLADDIDWVEIAPDRSVSFSRTGIGYLLLATGMVLGAMGLGASSIQMAALLLALTGPAIALLLLQRSDPGHIGVSGEQLLLVDHSGMYHFDGGGRIHHHGPFLMIDDVTVFTGAPLLPAFSPAAISEWVTPVAAGGVKVDRKIVTVKLLQARHPLAIGVVVILVTSASAVALLSLHGIF
jgi:hypothetical protein